MTYHHVDQTYFELINDVLTNGVEKTDRTGTGTISVFGRQVRYDLSLGFPILTSKRVHWKSVVGELLWFLRGDTNIKWLKDNGISIWDEWADKDGNLGPVYGFSWRRWEKISNEIILVPVKSSDLTPYPIKTIPLQLPSSDINDSLIGTLHSTKSGQMVMVLEKVSEKGEKNTRYKVQFQSDGFIAVVSRPNLLNGQVRNYLDRSVAGVGYLGDATVKTDGKLYNLWVNMIVRCYDRNHPSYALYGGNGITVSEQWHCFAEFCKTITQVPFYYAWIDNPSDFCLDKDYYGSKQYSPSTTIFLDTSYNRELAKATIPFTYKNELFISQKECAEKYSLDPRRISEILSGKRLGVGRYAEIKKVEPPTGMVYRRKRIVDQIKEVIQQIKTNPDSRRLIVSAWNVPILPKMALPPCHMMFQFYVIKGKLSCQLYMRSNDLGLGNPFNVASYALLTHMIAQVCGLEVGELIMTFGDLHCYSNHVEALKQQLHRTPYPMPRLVLDKTVTDIDGFDFDKVMLDSYQHHPSIKLPVAV
jgi:thymidylate synthase